jgi:hypothetical protein
MEKKRRSFLQLLSLIGLAPALPAVAAAVVEPEVAQPKPLATGVWFARLVTQSAWIEQEAGEDLEGLIYTFPTFIDHETAFGGVRSYRHEVRLEYPDGSWHTHTRDVLRGGATRHYIDGVRMMDIGRPGDVVYMRDEDDEFRVIHGMSLATIPNETGRGRTTTIFHIDEAGFINPEPEIREIKEVATISGGETVMVKLV